MSDAHDPLCRYRDSTLRQYGACDCDLIAKVRADERARFPQDEADWTPLVVGLIRDEERRWLRKQVQALRYPDDSITVEEFNYAIDAVLDLLRHAESGQR